MARTCGSSQSSVFNPSTTLIRETDQAGASIEMIPSRPPIKKASAEMRGVSSKTGKKANFPELKRMAAPPIPMTAPAKASPKLSARMQATSW